MASSVAVTGPFPLSGSVVAVARWSLRLPVVKSSLVLFFFPFFFFLFVFSFCEHRPSTVLLLLLHTSRCLLVLPCASVFPFCHYVPFCVSFVYACRDPVLLFVSALGFYHLTPSTAIYRQPVPYRAPCLPVGSLLEPVGDGVVLAILAPHSALALGWIEVPRPRHAPKPLFLFFWLGSPIKRPAFTPHQHVQGRCGLASERVSQSNDERL